MTDRPSIAAAVRTLTIFGNDAVLKTPYDLRLIESIRAVPGRQFDSSTRAWHVRMINDRPASMLALLQAFPELKSSEEDRERLNELVNRRAPAFALELISPVKNGPECVSILEAWTGDAEFRSLLDRYEHYTHEAVGRYSLELSPESSQALYDLHESREDVLWTRKLSERVDTLRQKQRRPALPAFVPTSTDGEEPTSVRFTNGREQVLVTTAHADAVVEALPGATVEDGRYVTADASTLVAVGMSALIHAGHELQMSPTVRAWMEGELRWDAKITARAVDGQPSWVVTGEADAHPIMLDDEPAEELTPETWRIPLDEDGADLMETLVDEHPHLILDARARRCLTQLQEHPDEPVRAATLTIEESADGGTELRLEVLWGDDAAADFGKLPGAAPDNDEWGDDTADNDVLIADAWNAAAIRKYAIDHDIYLDEATLQLLDGLSEEHERAEELVAMSRATEGSGNNDYDIPVGELMPFQIAGIEYALDRRRTFIADEQGLGKTLQALQTIEAANAYPAVILCPASLKLNWEREAKHWLPHRSVKVFTGRGEQDSTADLLVLNYEIVEWHRERLATLLPGALVLDESHYCKSPKAKRTKAVRALAEALPQDALRLALTGTPLVNRPKELVPQLQILGRLSEFGSGAGFERRFGSIEERERLHWHLRRTCYLRRLKKDVLPQLPEKQRAVVPVELSNKADYDRAEREFMSWLVEQFGGTDELDRKLTSAERGKALVKLGALRRLAGKGKVEMAASWIEDFLESGEKLVVFASHVDVQHALADSFPEAVHILGSDSPATRDAAVQRFQNDPDVQLCICSLRVAAHGLTLTAASDVAFVELGWTPAEHDQAEDRCHRIGQEDSVTAWYLLASGTIDERIAALIENKRRIVQSVTDGTAVEETSAIDAILADYLVETGAPAA
ncbi:MAG: DEAD/DEAH box helicase [Solirubrobacteraceae bacterium]|nr:DEAD/DEAH box helicase [Solirubrobacteraceae bacterium]